MVSKTLLYACFISQLALPSFGIVLEQLDALPAGWTEAAAPDSGSTISLSIGLAQQNLDQLESKLLAVSTPGNAAYGQYLDVDDVNALFAPTAEATSAVTSWLEAAGITTYATDTHSINFQAPVSAVNNLLNTTFKTYTNNGVQKIRTTQYSVPEDISDYIDLISPTVYFGKTTAFVPTYRPTPSEKRQTYGSPVKVDASCQTSITPSCLKELYNVGNYTPNANSGSKIGFGSFLNQSALYSDLADYEELFGIPPQNFSVELINGATNDQDSTTAQIGEADLDVQNIIGVAHPLPVVEFITGGSPPFIPNLDEPTAADNENEPYLPYYQYLLSKPNSELPQVISNSYGDDEQTVPQAYATRVCNLIGFLGLRGITVLESSGDTGVGSACQSNDGKKTPQFTPQFPGSCPWITAVGGTQFVSPEVAWNASSGGFSNYFQRPAYQEFQVENYLSGHISESVREYYQQFTNFNGRGFPDISAHSLTPDYEVVYDGTPSPSGGTSAAAPVVAAIIGLLNDARLQAGKPALGFLNPWLYAIGYTALNDITGGGALGCNGINLQSGEPVPGASVIPYASWNATVGWDPVTGLGTPNFQKLKTLVLSF